MGLFVKRQFLWNSLELAGYEFFKETVTKMGLNPNYHSTHFICGAMAGVVGTLAISPVEVVKTR